MSYNEFRSAATSTVLAQQDRDPGILSSNQFASIGSPVVFGGDPDHPVLVDADYWYVGAPLPPPGYRPPWDNPGYPDCSNYQRSVQPQFSFIKSHGVLTYADLPAIEAKIPHEATVQQERRRRSLKNFERSIRAASWYGREPALVVEYDDGFWLTHGPLARTLARIIVNAPGHTWIASVDAHLIDEMFDTGFPVFVREAAGSSGRDSDGFIITLIRPAAAVVQHGLDHVLGSCTPSKGDVW